MTQREAFEKAHMLTDLNFTWSSDEGNYAYSQTRRCWFTWQASAARYAPLVAAAEAAYERMDDDGGSLDVAYQLGQALAALDGAK